MTKQRIPKFKSEAEEAEWWFKNREKDDAFFDAARRGKLQRLTRKKLVTRIKAHTRVISIRVGQDDLALARKQAAERGLPYQTYMKSLLHQALRKNA